MAHMKERIAGKMANRSDNAFRLRRLFKMYDANHTGMVRLHISGSACIIPAALCLSHSLVSGADQHRGLQGHD